MKLKTFDATNCRGRRSFIPQIGFHKGGVITFNAKLVEKLNLNPGDAIIFHQDEIRKRDWYIEKSKTNGLELRRYKGTKNLSLIMNAATVCRELFASLGIEGPIKFCLASETTEGKYYAILTSGIGK
jgi:hypothetical protein